MAGRPSWTGSISFGLVNIPAKLMLQTEDKGVKFHNMHVGCGARVRMPKRCEKGHDISGMSEIEKGYEVSKGEYVIVTEHDLDQLPLPTKKVIQVEGFVPLDTINPAQVQRSYFLDPEEVGEHGYALLLAAMKGTKTVALARLAFRDKEHMAAVVPVGGHLEVVTLYWPDEMRAASTDVTGVKLDKDEQAMAKLLVESMKGEYESEGWKDHYRDALVELIDAKVAGKPLPEEPAAASAGKAAVSMMEALQASVAQANKPKRTAQKRKAS